MNTSHRREIEDEGLAREFEALYERMRLGIVQRDPERMTEILDADYVFTAPDGKRRLRDAVIDLEMQLPAPEEVGGIALQLVTDDVVIVRGHDLVKGGFPTGSVSEELAASLASGTRIVFTSVWRRRDGVWRMLSNDAHVDAAYSAS